MRRKIVAANWKMNLTLNEGKTLLDALQPGFSSLSPESIVVIAPPFPHIPQTVTALAEARHVYVGAQNCSTEPSGAFTGEVSAGMLGSAGCSFVILGHSERREYFQEDNEMLLKKVNQALGNNLQIIFCCGEPLSVRDAGGESEYVARQLEETLFHLSTDQLNQISIAYEPIWAIGTGRTATAEQAQAMHAHIRGLLRHQFGEAVAANFTLLYGGSCNAGNAGSLFSQPDVDGGLIGGASLKADTFLPIVTAMMES